MIGAPIFDRSPLLTPERVTTGLLVSGVIEFDSIRLLTNEATAPRSLAVRVFINEKATLLRG